MSGNGHPTEWISAWVDTKLQHLMTNLPTFLKDTNHLINLLSETRLETNSKIISLDVVSLYTNIPHEGGLKAILDVGGILDTQTDYTAVAELTELVLKNNIFKFDNKYYIQTQGTAMGTRLAPAYANIFMYNLEEPSYKKIIKLFSGKGSLMTSYV